MSLTTDSAAATQSPVVMPDGLVDPLGPAPRRRLVRKPQHSTLVLTVILVTQLMVVLDATIVNVALPDLQTSLHFTANSLSWVISGYTLTFGGLLMFGARCGDLLGRRRTFLAGVALFVLGSLAGGLAQDSTLLLAARAVQGVGGAFAAPATLALLTSLFPEGRERVRAIGLFTAVSVGGAASGMIAGGLLIHFASWRWVFFVNVPIGAVVFAIARVVLPETARSTGKFDVTGALTSTIGVGSLVYGFVEAGSRGWTDAVTLTALAVGLVLVAAFVSIERRAAQPILPLRLLSDRTRNGANLGRFLLYGGAFGVFFFMTQYLQDVRHYSALKTGFAFLPIPLTVFITSQLTTRVLLNRFNAKRLMQVGVALTMASLFLDASVKDSTPYAVILIGLVMLGVGNGLAFVTTTQASLHGVDPSEAGAASGLVNVMQQIGPALGVPILATVFSSTGGGFTHALDSTFVVAGIMVAVALVVVSVLVQGTKVTRQGSPALATAE